MPRLPPPSAEAHLAFLGKLQRLFAEGDFTATYKFALLVGLAAGTHLERWLERITRRADALAEIGLSVGIAADRAPSRRVGAWGYASAAASGEHAWLSSAKYEATDQRYLGLFDAQAPMA